MPAANGSNQRGHPPCTPASCPPAACRFLQPGLLLKGVNLLYDDSNIPAGQPRKSWVMRSWQQREAVAEGLAEWQANPYFAAGRVTVPALLDTFACQSFFNEVRWPLGCAAPGGNIGQLHTVQFFDCGQECAAQPPARAPHAQPCPPACTADSLPLRG